jgi:hypothetical protein
MHHSISNDNFSGAQYILTSFLSMTLISLCSVVQGLTSVSRAVIELKDSKEYTLAVEGNQFREVMITPGG